MNRGYLNSFEQTILYVLIFFILQEWLKPIMELTGTGYFSMFSLFIALCLGLSLFNLPFIAVWASKLIFTGWFIERVYNRGKLTVMEFFKTEITVNFEAITNAHWGSVTDSFRTFLFFVLIWMLVYLIHHWITVRMSIFYFLVMTVFFIATLDTLSDYNGEIAIVKVLLIGLLMTSLLFVKRFVLKRSILIDWQKILKYMIPIVLFIGFTGVVALMLPKAAPQWPDPVGYFENFGNGTSMGNGSGIGSSQKVGYGDNDEHLGGAFIADDTVVFEVNTLQKQYWRVETKDTYTSKGWFNSSKGAYTLTLSQSSEIEHSINVGAMENAEVATITNLSSHAFLLQPYGLINFDASKNSMDSAELQINALTEKMHLKEQSMTQSPMVYDVNFSEPSYSFIDLKATPVGGESLVDARYLDLPDSLPQRVKDLAQEITIRRSSAYDKARAIESYFSRNGFSYQTQDVAVPGEGQDYVDQFLFDTRAGYCDNFSTSMVVMLRAVDIPARWVKGFVTGDIVETYEGGRSLYEISNNEAHSWVEAYIEGIGWMPFEPTIGYSNPAEIDYNIQEDAGEDLLPEQVKDPLEGDKEQPKEQTPEEKVTPVVGKESGILKWLKIILPILGAILVIAALLAYSLRKKWLPKYYIQQNRKQGTTRKNYVISYDRLLKQLTSYGLKRAKGQTLQAYAARVDNHFGTDDMSKLTSAYERLIYSENFDETEYDKMTEIWEYLINRAIG